jgi:hypothetical protein
MPLARARNDASLTRIRHAVYVPTSQWVRLKPWDRYLARVHAVALVRPESVFCLESAAALFGLPLFGEARDIHLLDTKWPRSHRVGDVVLHTSVDERETRQLDTVIATSPAETVADLGRVLPPAFALAVVDAAISPRQSSLCSLEDVVEVSARQANRRGRRKLRWARERADPRIESVGEAVSHAVLEWLGFAPPIVQQEFRFEGIDDRVDFFWPEFGVLGESDGYGKYDANDVEGSRQRLIEEKVREDRLRRHCRGFARWDWADVMRARPLRDKLVVAGVPQTAQPQPAMLATLRSNPRSLPPAALHSRETLRGA